MTRALILTMTLIAPTSAAAAARVPAMADTIEYVLGWENPASQLYTVRTTARAGGEPVLFSLPAWRPGRYILQNYAANVQNVRAEDDAGRPLRAEWVDLDTWRVEPGDADRVTLVYEYSATTFDGGAAVLRPGLAYFNTVNLLPWVEGRIDDPARLTLEAPADWMVATQLERVPGPGHVFAAADYHALVDAPTIASADQVDWPFDVDGTRFHAIFRPAPDLQGYTREQVLADLAAIAREEAGVFGGFPFPEYRHLYQFVPNPFGHAVEHAASASYVMGPPQRIFANRDGYIGFVSVSAHELFHAWNVKRIRPAALWPYDYSRPQLTRLHWWTEGVTEYYSGLVLVRAGVAPKDEYWEWLSQQIESLETTPGRHVTSASLSSWTAWLTGYGGGNLNQAVSFYSQGSLLGLLLDLQIRDATDGSRGLDDVFRLLWEEYYEKGQGVPEDGIQRAVEEVAGRSFDDFFARYVDGTEVYPYAETLAIVGLDVRRVAVEGKPEATMGMVLRSQGGGVTVANVLPGSPALAAGVMRGDVVQEIDGEAPPGADIDAVLSRHQAGDRVPLLLSRGGDQELLVEVTLATEWKGNLRWLVSPMESPNDRQVRLREGWLASTVRPR